MDEKKIYIVLSQTGSFISHALKFFTHSEYNHVSISLTSTLKKMYSFGRLRPSFPFPGGFVEEGQDVGTFARFKKTNIKVLELAVTQEQFEKIHNVIEQMLKDKTLFHYNYFGIFLAYFKKDYVKENKFYCSQFVRYCLEQAGVPNIKDLPQALRPMDFLKLKNIKEVYTGLFKDYVNK